MADKSTGTGNHSAQHLIPGDAGSGTASTSEDGPSRVWRACLECRRKKVSQTRLRIEVF